MFLGHDIREGTPTLSTGEVHVWRFSLEVPDGARADWINLLGPDELAKFYRFRTDELRHRYLAAHARCRILLGAYLGVPPDAVSIQATENGKPLLKRSGWHFNLSHSVGRGLIALTRVAAIGVDVEFMAREVDREGIAARYFSARERSRLRQASAAERNEIFYRLWTAKEAWLKATGAGIAGGLDRVEFEVDADFGVRLGVIFEEGQDVSEWTIHSFAVDAEFLGAVAIPSPGVSLRLFHLD